MPKKKDEELVEVDFNDVREKVRNELTKRYGGVDKFLKNTDKGKEMGGMKIKPYLFNSGAVNYNIISDLCDYLGLGKLVRNIAVCRVVTYKMNKPITTDKTPKNNA